jgi:hypothetical protein
MSNNGYEDWITWQKGLISLGARPDESGLETQDSL